MRDESDAKAYSEDSLKDLFRRSSQRTTNIIICTAIFVVFLSFAIIALILCSSSYTKSYKKWKLLEKVKKNPSAIVSLAILSLISNIYIVSLASSAIEFWQYRGEDELRRIFHDFDKNRNLVPLVTALVVDIICLIVWIVLASTFLRYRKKCEVDCSVITCPNSQRSRGDNYECHCNMCTNDIPQNDKCDHCKTCTKCCNDYIPLLSLTVLSPIFCIIAHSPYIAIAYLDDGFHASSMLIYYSFVGYVLFGLLWLFLHWCEEFKGEVGKYRTITVILFIVILIFLGLVVTITCYFVLIPINKSISDAPNRLYGIYQSGGFIIGSFIVYKVLQFLRKKKEDTVTIELIHEILQKRLPCPAQ